MTTLAYCTREALRLIGRRPAGFLISLLGIGATLGLAVFSGLLLWPLAGWLNAPERAPPVAVLMEPGSSADDVQAVIRHLQELPQVVDVQRVPREAALDALARRGLTPGSGRDALPLNMPELVQVRLSLDAAAAESLPPPLGSLEKLPRVARVQFDEALHRSTARTVAFARAALLGAACLLALLALLSLMLPLATVARLDRAGVRLLSSLGATPFFVLGPYALAATGVTVLGGAAALVTGAAAYAWVAPRLAGLPFAPAAGGSDPATVLWPQAAGLVLLLGLGVGLLRLIASKVSIYSR